MDPHRLARFFLAAHGRDKDGRLTVHRHQDKWWRYRDGFYTAWDDEEVRVAVIQHVKKIIDGHQLADDKNRLLKVTPSVVTAVLNALASIPGVLIPTEVSQPAWLESEQDPQAFLCMQNGLLDMTRAFRGEESHPTLESHTPQFFTEVCLPYDYDQEAQCPEFLAFLDWMFLGDPEVVAVVQELFGYCLTLDSGLRLFFIFIGNGANGKSVLLDVLAAMVGEANRSTVGLEAFRQGDRFGLMQTQNKMVNICNEIDEGLTLAEGKLKAFVGGNPMTFEKKYKDPISMKPTAKLVFAANTLPKFADKSSGVWDRAVIIPCNSTVPEGGRDPDKADRLKEELSGILNWAIEGLQRVRRQGFTKSEVCENAKGQHRLESDPSRQFLEEECVADPKGVVECATLRDLYEGWCETNGHYKENANEFGKQVQRVFEQSKRVRLKADARGKRPWAYQGIRLSQVSQALSSSFQLPSQLITEEGENDQCQPDTGTPGPGPEDYGAAFAGTLPGVAPTDE